MGVARSLSIRRVSFLTNDVLLSSCPELACFQYERPEIAKPVKVAESNGAPSSSEFTFGTSVHNDRIESSHCQVAEQSNPGELLQICKRQQWPARAGFLRFLSALERLRPTLELSTLDWRAANEKPSCARIVAARQEFPKSCVRCSTSAEQAMQDLRAPDTKHTFT